MLQSYNILLFRQLLSQFHTDHTLHKHLQTNYIYKWAQHKKKFHQCLFLYFNNLGTFRKCHFFPTLGWLGIKRRMTGRWMKAMTGMDIFHKFHLRFVFRQIRSNLRSRKFHHSMLLWMVHMGCIYYHQFSPVVHKLLEHTLLLSHHLRSWDNRNHRIIDKYHDCWWLHGMCICRLCKCHHFNVWYNQDKQMI